MTKDPRIYLAHILEHATRIESYIRDGRDAFLTDHKTQDAVIRNFEVIGEAAKRIPAAFRDAHPSIPWRVMAAFRDVLIHGYAGVDLSTVWTTATEELPAVRTAIAAILPPIEVLEREIGSPASDRRQE